MTSAPGGQLPKGLMQPNHRERIQLAIVEKLSASDFDIHA